MKAIATTLFTGAVLALLAWWLDQEPTSVKYTLSEQIPLRFGGAREETVQQLEIKNIGDHAAEKIQVKLGTGVREFLIIKNSHPRRTCVQTSAQFHCCAIRRAECKEIS